MPAAFVSFASSFAQGAYQSMPSLIAIAAYVLSALAFYSMAQKRNIAHAWLAWMPIANVWILGSLSDQYRYVVKGQEKSKRKLILTLNILSALISTVLFFLSFRSVIHMLLRMSDGMNENMVMELMLSGLMKAGGILLLTLPLTILRKVLEFMALYDVYQSCEPQNAVMYLVLSILFPMIMPVFLFVVRDKELGMPPRRQEGSCQAPCYVPPAVQNPPAEENTSAGVKMPEEQPVSENKSEEVPKQNAQTPEYL